MAKVDIHLFRLDTLPGTPPLENLLDGIDTDPIEARNRTCSSTRMRLEDIERPTADRPFWLLDFVKLRQDHGPGIASVRDKSRTIPLAQGEYFTETTAALYDPVRQHLAVQYNHHGARARAIGQYFSVYDQSHGGGYELIVKLNQQAQARLESKEQLTSVRFKVAPANISTEFRRRNVSIGRAIQAQHRAWGGDFVEMIISVDARSSRSLSSNLLSELINLAGLGEEAVKTLEVTGRDDENEKLDHVDLVKEKETRRFDNLPVNGGGQVDRDVRWDRLAQAYTKWQRDGKIA